MAPYCECRRTSPRFSRLANVRVTFKCSSIQFGAVRVLVRPSHGPFQRIAVPRGEHRVRYVVAGFRFSPQLFPISRDGSFAFRVSGLKIGRQCVGSIDDISHREEPALSRV